MAGREREFSDRTKEAAIKRQDGVCAFCGVPIRTKWSWGPYEGQAHHFRPILHDGDDTLENCVYLCRDHHWYLGHGVLPQGLDKQGGSFRTRIMIPKAQFAYINGRGTAKQ